jgi:hypothetical protein
MTTKKKRSTKTLKFSESKRLNAVNPPDNLQDGPQLVMPDGDPLDIDPERLILDPQNLRLISDDFEALASVNVAIFGQHAIQEKLTRLIADTLSYDIEGLINSITSNGFLKHERLIVAKYDGEKFLVLEGNRRLTAVREIIEKNTARKTQLKSMVFESISALPCLLLKGSVIIDSKETSSQATKKLNAYRKAAEIYIGMRHLMGAKDWNPVARYEFLSRLVFEEGWSIDDVATRFGRKKSIVIRDLKAHKLYKHFIDFKKHSGREHQTIYNAFSEAARSPVICSWLGWSDAKIDYQEKKRLRVFFNYLVSTKEPVDTTEYSGEEVLVNEISAESAVRGLRDMLALRDELIESALEDQDFQNARSLYAERKDGELAKKIKQMVIALRRITVEEVARNKTRAMSAIQELDEEVSKTLEFIKSIYKTRT